MEEAEGKIQWLKMVAALILSMLGVLAIAAAIYGPGMWKARSPELAFQNYNRAMVARDYEAAWAMLAPETTNSGTLAGFTYVQQGLIEKHGELRGFEEGKVDTHLEDPAMMAIHATLIYEKGRVPFVFLLKKRHFSWDIYGAIEE
jgi:hypothetical protein